MSDIRALLDQTTTRRSPHPDPVTAVHATVRRRARRRASLVSAGAAFAVAGGAVAATGRGNGSPPAGVASSPSTTPAVSPTPVGKPPTAVEEAFMAYVRARPDRYELVTSTYGADDESRYLVAIGSDADPEAERRDLTARFPGIRWDVLRCGQPISHYRSIQGVADAAPWPSGVRVAHRKATLTMRLPARTRLNTWDPAAWSCHVVVSLRYIGARDVDQEYARQRWGDDVRVIALAPIENGDQPVAEARGESDLEDPRLRRLSALVTENPAAFLGLRVESGRAIVTLAGDADVDEWGRSVLAVAGRLQHRVEQCQWSRAQLEEVQGSLEGFDYPSGTRPAFGAHIDAKTCSVLMQTGDLPDEDEAALREAFGKKITIDQSGAPERR